MIKRIRLTEDAAMAVLVLLVVASFVIPVVREDGGPVWLLGLTILPILAVCVLALCILALWTLLMVVVGWAGGFCLSATGQALDWAEARAHARAEARAVRLQDGTSVVPANTPHGRGDEVSADATQAKA